MGDPLIFDKFERRFRFGFGKFYRSTEEMCGIVGSFSLRHRERVREPGFDAALHAMRARGPDAEAIWNGPGVLLGHRRLAVLDPEGGTQPLSDLLTGDCLVYNGELYNYREIRRQLEGKGYRFRTVGDTEVVLRAWQEWGHNAWQRFNGMFALALYDAKAETLVLARDHAGIKPLYWTERAGQVRFASSWAALMAFPAVPRRLHLPAVAHYLTSSRLTFGADTLLEDVHVLEPAHTLQFSRGRTEQPKPHRYWQLPLPAEKAARFGEAREAVAETLRAAVKRQLISDVPLGGFLSGGLDSTILAALAQEKSEAPYAAHSVGYAEDSEWGEYQEWAFVQAAQEHLVIPCTEVVLKPSTFVADWQHLLAAKGTPLSTPNEVAIYRLAQAFRQHQTVALSGEGADEVFGGYGLPHFSAMDYARAEMGLGNVDPAFAKALQAQYGRTSFESLTDHYLQLNTWIPRAWQNALWMPDVRRELGGRDPVHAFYHQRLEALGELSPVDRYLHLHAAVNLEGLLQRLDSSTMAASVEGRVPFTDREVMELAFSLPTNHKIGWENLTAARDGHNLVAKDALERGMVGTKRVLRSAFAAEVPADIRHRPKKSFPSPFRELIGGPRGAELREHLRGSSLVGAVFHPVTVDRLLERPDHPDVALALWPLVNLALWAEQWQVGEVNSPLSHALAS